MYDENKTWKESMLLPGPFSVFFHFSFLLLCTLSMDLLCLKKSCFFQNTNPPSRLHRRRPAVVDSEGGIFELTKSCAQARLSDGNCWVTAWGAVSAQPRRCRRGFTVALRVCDELQMRLLHRRLLFLIFQLSRWLGNVRKGTGCRGDGQWLVKALVYLGQSITLLWNSPFWEGPS